MAETEAAGRACAGAGAGADTPPGPEEGPQGSQENAAEMLTTMKIRPDSATFMLSGHGYHQAVARKSVDELMDYVHGPDASPEGIVNAIDWAFRKSWPEGGNVATQVFFANFYNPKYRICFPAFLSAYTMTPFVFSQETLYVMLSALTSCLENGWLETASLATILFRANEPRAAQLVVTFEDPFLLNAIATTNPSLLVAAAQEAARRRWIPGVLNLLQLRGRGTGAVLLRSCLAATIETKWRDGLLLLLEYGKIEDFPHTEAINYAWGCRWGLGARLIVGACAHKEVTSFTRGAPLEEWIHAFMRIDALDALGILAPYVRGPDTRKRIYATSQAWIRRECTLVLLAAWPELGR